ncbi:porin [Pseudomonadota bacterium]
MNKKLLTLAVAAAMVAPLAVQAGNSGPTVYGVAHVSVENIDNDANNTDTWEVVSRQSRFGIKGEEDLGNGLSAVYKMEFQIDMDDTAGNGATSTTSNADNLTARNQYVGLAHKNMGTLLLGRHDSPMKFMTISRDQFNTKLGDWNEVTGNSGVTAPRDRRVSDAILYKSPNFNGFEAAAMVSPGESQTADGLADGITSIGARYVNGPIYVGAAWEESDFDTGVAGFDEETTWRVAASYDIAGFKVSGLYEDNEDVGGINVDGETWQLALSYKFGNTVVKGMYQEGEEDNIGAADDEYEAFAIGVDHHFSKRTQVYAVYTETDDETSGANNNDVDAFGAGIIHKF